ncbi:hypothetical protein TNCT_110811 [Trichonephila clavata]|uniref:Uncharacterized protein n=1 Tax=Trichonephila clavata TaxID=2740835 RepID=A0A8X6HY65_TRICU|nr:hypothetical protein TNCT_110811 [Trichonephila clavata]
MNSITILSASRANTEAFRRVKISQGHFSLAHSQIEEKLLTTLVNLKNLPSNKMDESWTVEEENAVTEFRKLMKDEVPQDMYEDKYVFINF